MNTKAITAALVSTMLGTGCWLVQAQVLPQISLDLRLSGLQAPVAVTHAGDGSGRQFVLEQPGIIRIAKNGVLLPAPFLDISPKVLYGGERGLLGLAFPMNFNAKQYFYVYYTSLSGSNVVARYAVSADTNSANAASEQILLALPHPTFSNHNGGQLAFSPKDGFLYIGVGDGGGAGDPFGNAQNPQALLGKLLRIDVESTPAPGNTYVIPPTNPFVGVAGYRPEIWALGLRNPWRFSFDRLTGDLYIGDVGQSAFEEVDFQLAASAGGQNYGWNILEGPACYTSPNCVEPPGYVPPVMYYDHTEGIAILGGYVYRGTNLARMAGVYFFGDLTGKIWGLQQVSGVWQRQLLSIPGFEISSFGEDEAGNLYVADYAGGNIYELALTSLVSAQVLWTRGDIGSAALWQIDPSLPSGPGQVQRGWYVGPPSGLGAPWQASSYTQLSATNGFVLWTRNDIGSAALWQIDPSLPTGPGQVLRGWYVGPPSGLGAPWQASSYTQLSATNGYVLWTRSDIGSAALWQIDPSQPTGPGQVLRGWYVGSPSGLGAPWQASSYAQVSATEAYVLWTRSDIGSAALWQIDPSQPTGPGQVLRGWYVGPPSGLGAPWQASSYARVSATEAYVLWTRSDTGIAALWQIDPSLPTGPGQVQRGWYVGSPFGLGAPWKATGISLPGVP